jgi:hypothetical protein
MKVPPQSLFTAVVWHKQENPDAANSMEEPLIPVDSSFCNDNCNNSHDNDNDHEAVAITKSHDVVTFLSPLRLKTLSFATGCLVAFVSQYILSQWLWDDAVLQQSTTQVVLFSMVWSFWTCVLVFAAMLLLIQLVSRCHHNISIYNNNNNSSSHQHFQQQQHWDDMVFQMEAHHIVGSLLSISASWMLNHILSVSLRSAAIVHHQVLIASFFLLPYGLFVRIMTTAVSRPVNDTNDDNELTKQAAEQQQQQNKDDHLLSTYQLVAATLGLIMGVCSQFILSFFLWKRHMTEPIVDNVILFSLLWSLLTVLITFSGCSTLRFLIVTEEQPQAFTGPGTGTDQPQQQHNPSSGAAVVSWHAERVFLRMEAHYVFCSLIGICLAWILMDVAMHMVAQIVPSLIMLAVSLAVFWAILCCFPEEKCLQEMKLQQVQQQQNEQQQLLLVKDNTEDMIRLQII